MSNLSEFVRSRLALRQRPSGSHPDADLLVAFSEGALLPRERAEVVSHLEYCSECRNVLALTAPANEIAHELPKPLWWTWKWPATAAAATLVIAIALWPGNRSAVLKLARPPAPKPSAVAQIELPLETKPQQPPQLSRDRQGAVFESKSPNLKRETLIVLPETPPKSRDVAAQIVSRAPPPNTALAFQPAAQAFRLEPQLKAEWTRVSDGADIWVGGDGGKLFHSQDGGRHWTLIAVADGPAGLRDAIVKIDAGKNKPIELTTSSGHVWISSDGGLHWRQQQTP